MQFDLQRAEAAVEFAAVDAEVARQSEQGEMIARGFPGARRAVGKPGHQTWKLSPQPQASLTFGLLNLKPSLSPSRTKSSSVPSM